LIWQCKNSIYLEKYQLRADKKVYAAFFDGTLNAIPHFELNKLNELIDGKNDNKV